MVKFITLKLTIRTSQSKVYPFHMILWNAKKEKGTKKKVKPFLKLFFSTAYINYSRFFKSGQKYLIFLDLIYLFQKTQSNFRCKSVEKGIVNPWILYILHLM